MEIDIPSIKDKKSEAFKLKSNREKMKQRQRKNEERYEASKVSMR